MPVVHVAGILWEHYQAVLEDTSPSPSLKNVKCSEAFGSLDAVLILRRAV